MNINESATYHEIVDLILHRSERNDTAYIMSLEFILPDGTTVHTMKTYTVDIVRDFASNYSDYITVTASMNRLLYNQQIYLNRKDLKARLVMTAADPVSGKATQAKASAEYTVKLTVPTDEAMRTGNSTGTSAKADSIELHDVAMQLIPSYVEEFRFVNVSGVIRASTQESILKYLMSDCGKYTINVHKPDNQEPCKQLVLGQKLTLCEFPYWLQRYGGGVYSNNLGFYLYNKWVYIYPLHDTAKYNTRKKVTICLVGPGQLEGINSTYSMSGGKLRILSAGFIEAEDNTEHDEYNYGNGIAFNEPNLLGDAVKVEDGVASLTGAKYREHALDQRKLNNLTTKNRITANVHYEVSRLAANRGVIAHLNWDNANPTMIQPNMEVTVLYDTGAGIHTRHGVILGAEFISQTRSDYDGNGMHTMKAVVHLYLEKDAK